jgi:hypothetical protein
MVMMMMKIKPMDMVNVNELNHHQYPAIIPNDDENPNENYLYAKKFVEI